MDNLKKEISIGHLTIGGTNHIAIQSMTNTKTSDVDSTVKQINELAELGCEIIRVAVVDELDAKAISEIKKQITLPIVADIHFDYRLAILSIESGADKIRINPGNIGDDQKVISVINCAKKHNIPIRIGVNSGSLSKEILDKYGKPCVDALIESIDQHIKLFEKNDFTNIVLSIKTTNLEDTILANQKLFEKYPYPIHIGLTESGTKLSGTIRSSYVLGTLLNQNIGNTIRVSLTGNPCLEIPVAKEILSMTNHLTKPTLICCPTCGRTNYNMLPIVEQVEKYLNTINKKITVAIMGCVVNGPGEARHADIGIAGGNKKVVLFKKGEIIATLPENEAINILINEIEKM